MTTPLQLHISEAEICINEAERCLRLVENVYYSASEKEGLLMACDIFIKKAKQQIAMGKIYKR